MDELIRLPGAENSRRRDAMVSLVESIPRDINSGAQIVCDYYRAGAQIPRERLWRTDRHPATPMVIEYVGLPAGVTAARGWERRKQGHLWRVWIFRDGRWMSRADVSLQDHGDWLALMKPVLLEVYRSCVAPAIASRPPGEVAARLIATIEAELDLVRPTDHLAIIASVHQRLALLSAQAAA